MRRRFLIISVLLTLGGMAFVLYQRVDQGPYNFWTMPVAAHEYYACDKCGSLDGGIYGKGPHKRLRSESGHWCVHRWHELSRAEFKQRAADQFGVDWFREGFWWSKE